MNFFEHQDRAQRRSKRLVVLFFLAVVAIVAGVYLAFSILFYFTRSSASLAAHGFNWFDPLRLAWVGGGTLLVIFLGSMAKMRQISGGGASVAQMMGGTLVPSNTTDPLERRLLNVVEEMALASGLPVPDVYLLDQEQGINAFAAGFTSGDAVIGVTRGTMEALSRDQLQGVIAHEFSHILNGDMRLNSRLIGILGGILVIGLSGYWLLRVIGRSRVRGGRGGGGAVILGILVMALVLLVVGYLGLFFGKLIQAGVCRQREYLADASAVQFTRNPSGIAGALKKIGGLDQGSRIDHPNKKQASHLFFGNAVKRSFSGLLATHPPLVQRIKAIEPSFEGEFQALPDGYRAKWDRSEALLGPAAAGLAPAAAGRSSRTKPGKRTAARPSAARRRPLAREVAARQKRAEIPAPADRDEAQKQEEPALQPTEESTETTAPPVEADEVLPTTPEQVVETVGTLSPDHVSYSQALIDTLPDEVMEAIHEPLAAQAVLFCLLLDAREEIYKKQMDHLQRHAKPEVLEEILLLGPQIVELGPAARLPLVDLSLPALRRLSHKQYNRFIQVLQVLIEADERVDLFEFTLQKILVNHLQPSFTPTTRPVAQYFAIEPLAPHLVVLLSALARVGHDQAELVERAFQASIAKLRLKKSPKLCAPGECGLDQLSDALDHLALASPGVKQRVIEACATCVAYDGQVTVAEAELLRAIGDTMNCPIPPFLPDQQPPE
ncbi:MAG: M48 family metallopeptidase [Bradymonadales bacterium]|nr:M48 family metallopeptidase [Bradymonadales bacterium]